MYFILFLSLVALIYVFFMNLKKDQINKYHQEKTIEILQSVKPTSLIGFSINECLKKKNQHEIIPVLVKEIKDQIRDNEPVMIENFGLEFVNYFKNHPNAV